VSGDGAPAGRAPRADGPRAGLVALGDSISYGHGGMQSGLGSQSWAQWLAEALDLPFTRYAVNGATAGDVVRRQLPRLRRRYDVGTLYVGVNDVRDAGWDATAYSRDLDAALDGLAAACDRVLTMTVPVDVGLPPAGAKVEEANAIVERLSAQHGAVVADGRTFTGRAWVWADRVHATATGQVELADRAARALGAPLPSATVVSPPRPDGWYAWHYGKRSLREHAVAAWRRHRASR
jgi:lysophospholipase L1-like esterase